MWVKGTVGGVVVALALAAQASAAGERQTYSDVFTTDAPGTSTGRNYAIDYLNPDTPGGKPHAFSHLRVELAEGARFDTTAIPQCKASDAQLMAEGPSACPPETRVGTDETVVDSGFPDPGRFFNADFTFFNSQGELILVATVRDSDVRIVIRGKIGERTLDIENPMIPGTPPEGGAAKSQRGRFVAGPNYITTPPTCPASGYWVNRVIYTYRDGVTQAAESKSPCRRPGGGPADDRAPSIGVFGMPRGCASRRFRAHVRVAEDSRLRSAVVRLDGRQIAVSRHKRLSARIPVAGLAAGRHRIGVTATDAAGNSAERSFTFRRCN